MSLLNSSWLKNMVVEYIDSLSNHDIPIRNKGLNHESGGDSVSAHYELCVSPGIPLLWDF
jgi:hypothetical protein